MPLPIHCTATFATVIGLNSSIPGLRCSRSGLARMSTSPSTNQFDTITYPAYKYHCCPRPSTFTVFWLLSDSTPTWVVPIVLGINHRKHRQLKSFFSSRWSIWIYLVYQQSPTVITPFLIVWDILSSVCTGTCGQDRDRTCNQYSTDSPFLGSV